MIKLIASDMDGTLVNGQLEVSPENAQAIKTAQEQGIIFCVATGRSFKEAYAPLEKWGINCPLILTNGAQIIDENHHTIDLTPIPNHEVHGLWQLFKENGIYAELMTTHGPYSEDREERLKYFTAYIGDTMPHLSHQEALDLAHEYVNYFVINYVPDILAVADQIEIETLKYFIVDVSPQKLDDLTRKIHNKYPDIIVTSSGTYNVEATSKNAQKGIALLKLAEKYNFKPSEIMAIGDSCNDSSMLSLAGISVAMSNAPATIKDLARFETVSNEESGVAYAINQVLNGVWK